MKYSIQLLFVTLLIMSACGRSSEHHDHGDQAKDQSDPNEALANQVNEYHDKVMDKLEDIHKLKGQLKEKVDNATSMADEKKKEILGVISQLDSADQDMRDWMHAWMHDTPDSVDTEKTREYFESEMEKIKKVEESMIEAIDNAKAEVDKK